ncbi:30S ribosomal protein S11 [Candidatus Peregrinibacteria bacterium]|nr:30S ribosomal protein S11 [Candidatus Peregrinibacteria bacterium]
MTEKTKVKKSSKKLNVPQGRVYIQASFNNTIVTITDPEGKVLTWASAGASGFKGTRKATPYAAQVAAENAVGKALSFGLEKVNVFIKGVGTGREQALRGLHSSGLQIETITDLTGIPHNGCRPKKKRRV